MAFKFGSKDRAISFSSSSSLSLPFLRRSADSLQYAETSSDAIASDYTPDGGAAQLALCAMDT